MKIMYWNLYEGCTEPGRLDKVIKYIKLLSPDILGLSELNGWQENSFATLRHFQQKAGFPHVTFAVASSGYNLGLFSKNKPAAERAVTQGFNTGLIQNDYTIAGRELQVSLTHMHHISEAARLKELPIIFKNFRKNGQAILMGDLNSLSPQDEYPEKKLLIQLRDMHLKKFGTLKLERRVISKILDLGLVDSFKHLSKKFQYSVPTKFNRDPKHFNELRLDYIFATKNLARELKRSRILNDKNANMLSDHFPVVAEF